MSQDSLINNMAIITLLSDVVRVGISYCYRSYIPPSPMVNKFTVQTSRIGKDSRVIPKKNKIIFKEKNRTGGDNKKFKEESSDLFPEITYALRFIADDITEAIPVSPATTN